MDHRFNKILIQQSLKKTFLCFLFLTNLSVSLISCEEKKKDGVTQKYNGPMMTMDNLSVMFSDSGRTTVKFTTARQMKMQNEDDVYPKAVYVTFFDKNSVEYSSLRGDSGRYFKNEGLYKVMGNVFFFNRLQQQSLATDLLFWSPVKKIIYTDLKFTIKTPKEELHDIGMQADQDFTHYTMRRAKGTFDVDSLSSSAEAATDTTSY